MTSLLDQPLLAATLITALGLALRRGLLELRWWLALRGAAPAERPEIIRALHGR